MTFSCISQTWKRMRTQYRNRIFTEISYLWNKLTAKGWEGSRRELGGISLQIPWLTGGDLCSLQSNKATPAAGTCQGQRLPINTWNAAEDPPAWVSPLHQGADTVGKRPALQEGSYAGKTILCFLREGKNSSLEGKQEYIQHVTVFGPTNAVIWKALLWFLFGRTILKSFTGQGRPTSVS